MLELVLRIGFSLLIVFGLMWGLAKLARRPLSGHRGTGALSVLHRQQLSRTSSVAIVRVADRGLILGVTENQVTLLGETDPEPFEKHPHPHPHPQRRDPLAVDPGGDLTADSSDSTDPHALSPVDSGRGRLDGSVLSPRTWSSTLDFLRDRTTRPRR